VQSGELYSDKQISRLSKRKAVVDQLDANRQEFFSGEFDGFVPHTMVCASVLTTNNQGSWYRVNTTPGRFSK